MPVNILNCNNHFSTVYTGTFFVVILILAVLNSFFFIVWLLDAQHWVLIISL